MEPFILLALAGGGALAVALNARQQRRRRASLWRRAAEACGLADFQESNRTLWARLRQGGLDDLTVTLQDYHRGKGDKGTRIVVKTPDSRMGGLRLHAESLTTDLRRMFGANEIEVGDPAFDANFFVGGQVAPSMAFLDHEMRALLLDLKANCRRMEVARGELQADVREWMGADLMATLPAALYRMLEIGRRWPHHSETAARVARNLLRDPQIRVRLRNLTVLIREMPDDPTAREALRAACADPWPEIRLRAAVALGTQGHDVLFQLAEGVEDDVAAEAIGALGRWLPPERALAILENAIDARRDRTAAAGIALLGRTGGEAGVARLAQILAGPLKQLRIPAIEALGWSGRASAEAPLVGALRHRRPKVRQAAAVALGRVGTVAAVLPLQEAAERDSGLRSTVRQSIGAIQSRATGASPGQLSITSGETGQLSLAAGDAGQLSLPGAEPGRVSVRDEEPDE